MRKIMAIALAAVACSATLTLTSATDAAAAGRGPAPHCVKVRKFFDKGDRHYVRLTNLCAKRSSCYTIVVPHRKDPHGRLAKGTTKDVRYGKTSGPRALYVKNSSC